MEHDLAAALHHALSMPDDPQKLKLYKHLLSTIVSSSDATRAKLFIDHLVSGEVPEGISHQLLDSLADELLNMDPDAHKEIARYAFMMIRPHSKNQEHNQKPKTEKGFAADRSYHTVTAVGNKLVLFGGLRENESLNDVIIYDTLLGKWIFPEILGTPPTPRHGHSAVLLNEERILIFGGNGCQPKDAIWFLEVDTPFVRKKRQVTGKEVVVWSRGVVGSLPKPVVICGPSGVGKGTLISRLMKEFPDTFGFSVSHTTRRPRDKEQSGVHYHFTERSIMELEIQEGKFLESATVHGNLYGTSVLAVEAVADAGKICILDIDVQGAQEVKKSGLDASFIFIAPPSLEQLEKRLRGRGTETEEQIQKRLNNAKLELEHGRNSLLFKHYLVNDDLDDCYLALKKVLHLDGLDSDMLQNGSSNQLIVKPRYGHTAAVVGGCVYIFGGDAADDDSKDCVIIIDCSSLAGGAPALTTGLRVSSYESIENGTALNGHKPVASTQILDEKIEESRGHEGNGHL